MLKDATKLNLIDRLVPAGFAFEVFTIRGFGMGYPNRFIAL